MNNKNQFEESNSKRIPEERHNGDYKKSIPQMKKILIILLIQFALLGSGFAQELPYLIGLNKKSAAVGETVIISGIQFSENPTQNLVLFGAGKATVVSATNNALEVLVPSTATFGPVQVTNLTTGLTAFTSDNFAVAFGKSTFNAARLTGTNSAPTAQRNSYDLCLCDFNLDGKLDVAVSNQDILQNTEPLVSVFTNKSTVGTLAFDRNNFALFPGNTLPTINTQCGDLDGDGKPDLVYTDEPRQNVVRAANGIIIFRNTTTGNNATFAPSIKLEIPNKPNGDFRDTRRIAINDIDKDGKPEIIVTNTADATLYIFKNTSTVGNISFNTTPQSLEVQGLTASATLLGLDVADLNKDGFPEIIVTQFQGSNFFVFRNLSTSGTINFTTSKTFTVAGNFINIKAGDFDNDGKNDIAITNPSQNNITILRNTTAGSDVTFGAASTFPTNTSPWGLDFGDLNGDGKLDMAVSSLSTNLTFTTLINTTTGTTFTFTRSDKPVSSNTRNIKIGDLDNDGRPDIATTGFETATLLTILNKNCIQPEISGKDQVICSGTRLTLSTNKIGSGTYQWFRDNQAIANATASTFDVTATGSYTVRITMDGSGCNLTSTTPRVINVVAGPATTPEIVPVSKVCQGESLTLSSTSGGGAFLWSGPNGFEGTGNPLVIPNFSVDKVGTYSLQIQNGSCLSNVSSIVATLESVPQVSITNAGSTTFCIGGNSSLKVTEFAGYTYEWQRDGSPLANTNSTTLAVTETGSYTASIIGANGCRFTTPPVTISFVNPPTSLFAAADSICFNVPLSFTASSTGATGLALSYNWAFGDGKTGSGAQTTNSYSTPGTFRASLTTSYSQLPTCKADFARNVIVTNIPNVSIGTPQGTEKCPSGSVSLNLPGNFQSYSWSNGNTTNSITVDQPGTFSVTAKDKYGCTFNSSVTITNFQNSGLEINSTNSTLKNDTIILVENQKKVDLVVTGGNSFEWLPEDLFIDPTSSMVSVYPRDINTLLTVRGNDINGCNETKSIRIINNLVTPRTSFSPNGDGFGKECWEITNTRTLNGCKVYIFDNRGRNLLVADSPFENDCIWDGSVEGLQVPTGVYFFVMKCEDTNFNRSGSIMLAR